MWPLNNSGRHSNAFPGEKRIRPGESPGKPAWRTEKPANLGEGNVRYLHPGAGVTFEPLPAMADRGDPGSVFFRPKILPECTRQRKRRTFIWGEGYRNF